MDRRDDDVLLPVAEAIADERDVDWSRAPEEPGGTLDGLRAVSSIAAAFRASCHQPRSSACEVLFRWGHLEVIESLGEGSFGEVFRARDPVLDREVALKLRRDAGGAESSGRRFLEEARRLARVKHPNVLPVHGADVHEGRVGIWTDLVEGVTLADWVARHGPMGAGEAAAVGRDLCRALAAVHQAGMVHGDVKAANVMRETGGRIVLMDFGCVTLEARSGRAAERPPCAGTPACMAPEVLAGATPTRAADVFSLGVLLYRLLTGHSPWEASTVSELLEAHATKRLVPLRARRPELPSPLVAAVERAMAADPAERFPDTATLERALAGAEEAAAPSRRSVIGAGLVALAAAGLLFAYAARREEGGEPPAARAIRWEAQLVRVGDGGEEPLANGARVAAGDRLAVRVEAREPLWVYLLNADAAGDAFGLFPREELETKNPLAAGRHRLPGNLGGRSHSWLVTTAGGRETFLAIAARGPLSELESTLAELARRSSGGELALRGVGALAADPDPSAAVPWLDRLERRLASRADVAVLRFELSNPPESVK